MKQIVDYARIGEREFVKDLIPQIVGNGGSFMFWRLPDTTDKNLIICNNGATVVDEISIEDSRPGFAIAPFHPHEKKFYFRADLVFRFKGEEIVQGPDLSNTPYRVGDSTQDSKTESAKYHIKALKNAAGNSFQKVVEAAVENI